MDNLVVGSDECEILDIVEVIMSSSVNSELSDHLGEIGMALKVPKDKRDEVDRKIKFFSMMTPAQGLEEFLMCWRSKESDKATLAVFIGILKTKKLNQFAILLENRFKPTESGSDSGDSQHAMEAANKQKEHIEKNLGELAHDISLSPLFMAGLTERKILHDSDVAEIEEHNNKYTKAVTFFKIIQKKLSGQPHAYASLIEILDQQSQSGVIIVLKKLEKKYW